jgi:hypothetical protein
MDKIKKFRLADSAGFYRIRGGKSRPWAGLPPPSFSGGFSTIPWARQEIEGLAKIGGGPFLASAPGRK